MSSAGGGTRAIGGVVAALLLAGCSTGTGDAAESGSGVEESRTPEAEPASALVVVPLDLGPGEAPQVDSDDVLIDGGSTATVVEDGGPWWIGLDGDAVLVTPVEEIAPDLEARVAAGFNRVAACGSTLVLSLVDPEALVAIEVSSASVLWESTGHESPQIACGDADVLVVQTSERIDGLDISDGSPRWAVPASADDPLRLTPDQALVGSYDGIVGIDLVAGNQRWVIGASTDAVVVPSPVGALLRVDLAEDGPEHAVVTPDGAVAFQPADDDLASDPWSLFLAGSGEDLVIVDPGTGAAIDSSGSRSLLSDEIVEVLGQGPDGRIWAVVATADGELRPGLIDTSGEVVETVDVDASGPNRIALPGMLILLDAGSAIIATG